MVGFLGEKNQYGWWHTAFFGPTGTAALAHTFPHSAMLAQFTGASEAARRLHDEHIGVGRVFHLFRLPEEIEQDLHGMLKDGNLEFSREALMRQEAAITELQQLTQGIASTGEGPVVVGDSTTLSSADAIQKLAALYLSAFQNAVQVYPYFRASS